MTKEEYERLLKSDYWKGYSYSLIKERGFTCEDCGKRFYNERNKLQVHHLVYRDVNPWSYSPDEVVVLCEDCHKKRHGLPVDSKQEKANSQIPFGNCDDMNPFGDCDDMNPFGDCDDTNPFGDCDDTNPFEIESGEAPFNNFVSNDPFSNEGIERDFSLCKTYRTDNARCSYPIEPEPRSGFKFRYVLYGLLLFLFILIGREVFFGHKSNSNKPSYEKSEQSAEINTSDVPLGSTERTKNVHKSSVTKNVSKKTNNGISTEENDLSVEAEQQVNTVSMPAERTVSEPVDEAKSKNNPSRELSTIEMLERRNHEDVVRRAQRAGVSIEGSTIDILERINHAEVVKRAQRAGVSTEGSTIEILERINHADVVKRAKRLGVSTEGSTIEILERINRKELGRYNN